MDRLESAIQGVALTKRNELLTMCANGQDDDLPVEERPSRAQVAPGCVIKFGDDTLAQGVPGRVLCPGRGMGWFYALTIEESGFVVSQFHTDDVTDRAPADANETPMPIFPEPVEEPPPEEPPA